MHVEIHNFTFRHKTAGGDTRDVSFGQTRVSDLKGLTVVNQRKWPFMYERLVKEVRSVWVAVCLSFDLIGAVDRLSLGLFVRAKSLVQQTLTFSYIQRLCSSVRKR